MSLKLDYNSDKTQKILVTLSESLPTDEKSIEQLRYKVVLTHEQSDYRTTNYLMDESIIPFRINEFNVTTTTGDTAVKNLNLIYSGWYKYEIYRLETISGFVPEEFPDEFPVQLTLTGVHCEYFNFDDDILMLLKSDNVWMEGYVTNTGYTSLNVTMTDGKGEKDTIYSGEWYLTKVDGSCNDPLEIGKCYVDDGTVNDDSSTYIPTPTDKYVYKKI